uniref:superoxide dismutase n=1 Tax=Lactuca sativa TaxID=4236 RepID=A0A9R1X526_LACSA|nr:hypothetical protein LSAT_V11C600340000 [Lactuca sativa]
MIVMGLSCNGSFLQGHVNHSIFWKNLTPTSERGGEPPHRSLGSTINQSFSSVEKLIAKKNAKGDAVQGSGWVWLAVDIELKRLVVETTSNQDPLVTKGPSLVPLLGIDVSEHAFKKISFLYAMLSNTAETVKRARELRELGVYPMVLMSQMATLIMDIIARTYQVIEASADSLFDGRSSLESIRDTGAVASSRAAEIGLDILAQTIQVSPSY